MADMWTYVCDIVGTLVNALVGRSAVRILSTCVRVGVVAGELVAVITVVVVLLRDETDQVSNSYNDDIETYLVLSKERHGYYVCV